MVNAGASIEAFLKLDATQFKNSLENVSTSVTKFKESMMDVGNNSTTFNKGMNDSAKAVNNFIMTLNRLDTVETKTVNKFKTLASAMNKIAEAAQRMSTVMQRGGTGIQALSNIIEVFDAGMASAEVQIKLTNAQLQQMTNTMNNTVAPTKTLKTSFNGVKNDLINLSRNLNIYGTNLHRMSNDEASARAVTQILRKEFGLTGQTLVQVRNQLNSYSATIKATKMSLVDLSTGFSRLTTNVNPARMSLVNLNTQFSQLATRINPAKMSLIEFTNQSKNAIITVNELGRTLTSLTSKSNTLTLPNTSKNILETNPLEKKVTVDLEKQSEAIRRNGAEILRNMGYKGKLSIEEDKLSGSSNRLTSSFQRQSSASIQASTSMNRQATATRGLGKAFSSLKMIGTMVASMMVWNFAHNMITATRETVNAKSEMEGYFKMLKFGQRDIDHFNQALNNTVGQFQRVNKYALGETISSIGVEFDLSTKEMEKAMKVTSMITSEYLRAGRNANEASLAVKDVLQGQFQRLSRETGVKGEQLKDAGWSGDTTDVLGLMEALEKVGMSRNWDVFAEKANSLNDIVTILQNRFGEWSAEMVNIVQPSIISVFNVIMSTSTQLGGALTNLWKWLNDTPTGNIVGWGLLATAITGASIALVVYRTGANLTQLVQMGLRGSIMATIFTLKAEEVATYGSRNALFAKLTAIKAETVAQIGVKKAIVSKVVGLNAEKVAQFGVKGAVLESIFARQYETAVRNGANVKELESIALHYKEMMSKISTTQALWIHVFGLEAETVAYQGTIVALAERVAKSWIYIGSLEAETVAEMGTAQAALFLTATLTPLIAILAGLAIGLYSLIKPLQDSADNMKKFGDLVENGDDTIKSYKESVDSLTKSKSNLESKLSELEKGTKKYKRLQDELKTTTKDLKTANKNYENSIKAVEMARSRQAKFEEKRDKIRIHNQTLLEDAYIKAGISASEASELASHDLNVAKKGAEDLRRALQMLKLEADKGAKKNKRVINMLDQYGLSDETIKKYGTNMSEAQAKISEGMERLMTSDDLMDRFGGWFEIQQGRLEEWWTELNAFFEVRDWDSIGQKIQEGLMYVATGFGALDWITPLTEAIGDKGIVGAIMEVLWGEGDSDGILDIAWNALNSWILEPIGSWFSWLMEDPKAHWEQYSDELSLAIAKALFGKDQSDSIKDITDKWIHDTFIKPLEDRLANLPQEMIMDIVNFFGGKLFDWGKLWDKILFGDDSNVQSYSFDKLKDDFKWALSALGDEVDKFVADPLGYMGIDLSGFSIDNLINGLFNSDGSSSGGARGSIAKRIDVSWLVEYVNNNIVIPLMNFVSNPIATLSSWGITLPQLDLGALVQGLFNIGGDGFDIGGWLASVFNIDAIVSTFTTNLTTIFTTASSIANSVTTVFSNLKSAIWGHIQGILSNVTTTFTSIKTSAVNQINGLSSGIQGGIDRVKSAFVYMKNSILDSAKLIYDGVKEKFDGVKKTIGDFWNNLTNPSSWGSAGSESYQKRSPKPSTARRMFQSSPVVRSAVHHGAGVNPYKDDSQSVRLKDLMGMVNGDNKVKLSDFLALFSEGGFGTWDFHEPYKKKAFDTAQTYKTGSPNIKGIGTVGSGYEVRKFWNGKPSFSFDEFQAVAQAIFSAIPYKFYYDSEWKGNWVNALLSGAVNCSDGADALIALARVFGFDGYKQHTTLKNGIGHFFAVIGGRPMDTTHFQNSGSWSPLGGAGIPTRAYTKNSRMGQTQGKTITVNNDFTGAVFYGVDDFDNRVKEVTKDAIREEFNDPYTVAI